MLQIRECISFVNFSFSRWNFNISLFSMGLFYQLLRCYLNFLSKYFILLIIFLFPSIRNPFNEIIIKFIEEFHFSKYTFLRFETRILWFLSIIKMLFKFSIQRDISYYWFIYFFFLQSEILSMRLLSNSWKNFIFRSIRSCGLKHVFSSFYQLLRFYLKFLSNEIFHIIDYISFSFNPKSFQWDYYQIHGRFSFFEVYVLAVWNTYFLVMQVLDIFITEKDD